MASLRNLLLRVVQAQEPPKKDNEPETEDSVADPFTDLRDECAKQKPIKELFRILEECNDRVQSKSNTTETCEQELFDFIKERDHCATKTLFNKLK